MILFGLAHRLHLPVTDIEEMSHRQVVGWVEYFHAEAAREGAAYAQTMEPPKSSSDGGIPYKMLSKADKRAVFR